MLFVVFFLVGVYASTAGSQDFGFVCGFEPSREEGATGQIHDVYLPFYQSSTVRPLILFGKLNSPDDDDPFSLTQLKDRNGHATESSANLLNAGHEGSLAHYFQEMSYGALTLEDNGDGVEGMWFEAKKAKVTDYGKTPDGNNCGAAIQEFAKDVFAAADDTINFSDYDRDGDRDGNGVREPDGVVDLVILYIPLEFKELGVCSFHGTVITDSGFSHETKDPVVINGTEDLVVINDNVIYVIQRPSFPYLVGVTAHEYGHVMDLPELYDRKGDASAGIGLWGVMGHGPFGWSWNLDDDWSQNRANDLYSGPTPLSVWSRYKVGWITEDNGRLVTVESDTKDAATLHDINSQSSTVKAYKIPVRGSDTEYFLMANRQNTYTEHSRGSYYDDSAEASGLAIWHIDDGLSPTNNDLRFAENNNEKHKLVDLECADGLFSDQGYPGNNPDPVAGGDNLDYAAPAKTNNGNFGDATDLWDGSTGPPARTEFTPTSNPSSSAYNGDNQNVFTGIAVRNIAQNNNGSVSVKIHFIPLAPTNFRATLSTTVRRQVDLSWSAPASNGAAITGYEYSDGSLDSDGNERWTPITDEDGNLLPNASSVTIGGLTGREYTFKVRAFTANEKGQASASAFVDLLSQTIEGAARPSVAEVTDPNATGPVDVGVYRYTDPNPNSPVWSLTGADADYFTLVQKASNASNERTLQFKEPPNYEVPLAEGGYKTTYNIGVKVQDVPLSGAVGATGDALEDILLVTVTVTNVEEAGSVTLSPLPPRVGVALVAQLTDPDEGLTFTGASWAWQRRAEDTAAWESVSTGAVGATENYPELSSYTPTAEDVGYHLRATVDYTDNHGPNKSAASAATEAIVGVPAAPTLSVQSVGSHFVTLAIQREADPNCPITHTEARSYSLDSRGDTLWAAGNRQWTRTGVYPEWSFRGLDTGTAYTFEVRSINCAGAGGIARLTVTPEVLLTVVYGAVSYQAVEGGAAVSVSVSLSPAADRLVEIPIVVAAGEGTEADDYVVGGLTDGQVSFAAGASSQTFTITAAEDADGDAESVLVSFGSLPHQVRAGTPSSSTVELSDRVSVPEPPGALTAEAGNGQVVLAWEPPTALGGLPLSGYAYRQSTDGGTTWELDWTDVGLTTSQTLKLTNGTAYTFEVRAHNRLGASRPSPQATATPDAPGTVELSSTQPRVGEPITATLSDPDGGVRNVRWSWLYFSSGATGQNGEPVTADASNEFTPSRVLVGVRLQARVLYDDQHGTNRSAVSVKTEPVVDVPDAPVLSVQSVGSHFVTLGIQREADPNCPITHTEARYYSLDSRGDTLWAAGNRQWSRTEVYPGWSFRGLDNGTAYTFEVRSINCVGAGGIARLTVTPGALLTVVYGSASYQAVEGGAAVSVSVALSPAADRLVEIPIVVTAGEGTEADDYTVGGLTDGQVSFAEGASLQTFTITAAEDADGDAESVLVSFGLLPHQVRAGTPSSSTVALSDRVSVPEPPGALTAEAGDGQVVLAWEPPTALGGLPLSGYAYRQSTDGGTTWELDWTDVGLTTSQTLKLTNGTAYTFEVRAHNRLGASRPSPQATATPDAPGTVTLSSTAPRVGEPITATLSDPDGGVRNVRWSWLYFSSGATGQNGEPATADASNEFTPSRVLVGVRLQARVLYDDQHGTNRSAVSVKTEPVVGVPDPPELTADAGNGQVVLEWTAPASDGGSPITSYAYRQSADGGSTWSPDWTDVGLTTSQTLTGLKNGTAYTFEVRAVNAVGAGAADRATATPVQPNRPPELSGPEAPSFAENSTGAVATYTASDPDKDALAWSLEDDDAAAFRLVRLEGTETTRELHELHFERAPDFETKSTYAVAVVVSDGSLSSRLSVTVTVDNVDEPGTVTLSSTQPRVGEPITATLSDPDGDVRNVRWSWLYFSSGATGQNGEPVAEDASDEFTPSRVLVGVRLQARALYDDGHDTGKSAQSVKTDPVVDVPDVPELTAEAGNEQVTLRWSTPDDNGSPITSYDYRQSTDGGSTWSPDWTDVGSTTGLMTLKGLTNGTAYTFEVRAVNAVGAGAADRATATPVQPNRPPELSGPEAPSFAEHGTGAVAAYTASDPDNDELTWSLTDDDASSFRLVRLEGTETARELHFESAPNFETKSTYEVAVVVSDGSLSATVSVTVTVDNVEEPGTVTLSSTQPQVGSSITATLSDPDGNVRNVRWSWLYFSSGAAGQNGEPVAEDASDEFTPSRVLEGLRLQARALYDDGQGTSKSAVSVKTDPVVDVPDAPELTAEAGNGQVTLRWSTPDDNGSPITSYAYRQSADGGSTWSPDWTDVGSTTSQTLTGLTNGTAYTFEVRAVNAVGAGAADRDTATPEQPNRPPELSGPEAPSFAEHGTGAVATYTASDPDKDELTWSLEGDDASSFRLGRLEGTETARELHFESAPNFETKSTYEVAVVVSDGSLSATVSVTVTVDNVEEPGTVTLSSTQPQVGSSITATLSDPDGNVRNVRWSWLYFSSGATGQNGEPVAEDASDEFTPSRVLEGLRLQARALYDDGQGTNKSAVSVKTDPVVDVPDAPELTAEAGNGQVTLRWSTPDDNGSPITSYDYRQSTDGGSTWSPNWTDVGLTTSQTLTGLTNGTTYTFEVRAVNAVGAGAADRDTATPEQPNRPPVLSGPEAPSFAEHGTGAVATYTASDPDNDELTWSLEGDDAAAFRLEGTGTTRTLHFKSAPNFETKSTYAVAVVVSDGSLSATVSVTVTVDNVEEPGTVTLSSTQPQVGSSITATLSDPDGDVRNVRWSWLYFSSGPPARTASQWRRTPPMSSPPAECWRDSGCKREHCMMTGRAPANRR